MILKELLSSVEFEEIIPRLKEREAVGLFYYKIAFDTLCRMKMREDDGIKIDVESETDESGERYVSVHCDYKLDWDLMLARTINLSDDLKLTNAELAAEIVWEMTFHGFFPQQIDDFFDRIGEDKYRADNPYVEPYRKIRQKQHDLHCDKQDIGTMHYSTIKSMFKKYPLNGPKRHCEARIERRCDYLYKMVNRWELNAKLRKRFELQEADAEWLKKEILFGIPFHHTELISACDKGSETDYIAELLQRYFVPHTGEKSIVLISGNKDMMSNGNILRIKDTLIKEKLIPSPTFICSAIDNQEFMKIDMLVYGEEYEED